MLNKNLIFFSLGAILASGITSTYFKVVSDPQSALILVHKSWKKCVEGILEYKGSVNKVSRISFPSIFSDWTVMEIVPSEKYIDLEKNYSTCLLNGYMDTSINDPSLEEKIGYYDKLYDGKIYIHHSPLNRQVRIYFESRNGYK